MSLKQVRTLALAATLLAGTTALAYAQSSSSSMGTGGSSAKHGESSSTLGTGASSATGSRHDSGSASTMGAGGSSATNGESSSSMGTGGASASSGKLKKGEEGKSSAMKSERGKSTSGKAENGKSEASKNAEQGKSSTSGNGTSSAESGKNGAKGMSTNGTMDKSENGTTGKGSNASSSSSSSSNAAAHVNLTTQQRTEIKNTVIENKSAPRVSHVDFNVSVGTVVPTTVHFARVPETIVRIHPAWRDYDYFVYNDEVIIIQPHTRKIVEIIVVS